VARKIPKSSDIDLDPAKSLEGLEQPGIRWKTVAQIGAGFAVLWVMAVGVQPWLGWWGIGVAAVLTVVAAGFGLYVWRLTRKSRAIVDILSQAKDDAGRKAALAQLEGAKGAGKDAMNALARAQLLAQENPAQAIEVLESVDLAKAPAVVQDDVRANLALMYLNQGRAKDARGLADDVRLDRQPQAKAKAMYAAVVAEAFARTGKAAEAKKLLETYDAADPAYGEVRAMLLRAQVFTYTATKNRGLARSAIERLAAVEPNLLGVFVQKGTHPELRKLATAMLQRAGAIPTQRVRMKMK